MKSVTSTQSPLLQHPDYISLRPLVDGNDFPCHALNRDRMPPCAELAWEVSPMCASMFTESLSLTPIAESTRPSRDIALVIKLQQLNRFDSSLAGRPTLVRHNEI